MAFEERCFTFTWKLENARHCLQKKGVVIKSPAFTIHSIEDTVWKIGLYPRGKQYGNYIGFYLYREAGSKALDLVEIRYELELVTKDTSNKTQKDNFKYIFPKNHGHGSQKFAELKDVFIEERPGFSAHDTLTARCRIWRSIKEMTEDVHCFARTHIGVQKRSYLWNVKNFSTLDPDKKSTYQIKSIENDTPLISVDLSLSGGLNSEEVIRCELSLQDQTIKFSTLRLSLVNALGEQVECNREEFWFDDQAKPNEFKLFFTKSKLTAIKSSYLPNDVLSLRWEWAFSKGVVLEDIQNVQHACTDSEIDFLDPQSMNDEKTISSLTPLNDNLKSLYDDNFLCDVQLKTDTGTFPAHKIILSAASSVFKAMFSTDMKEKNNNCVSIEDVSDDTIRRLLVYIYTARVDDLTWDRASPLYAAADKYAIFSLKNICSSYLKNSLSLNNACEVLLLSDYHADGDLKSAVQNYILINVKGIIISDGWKTLLETNAKLAAETLCILHK